MANTKLCAEAKAKAAGVSVVGDGQQPSQLVDMKALACEQQREVKWSSPAMPTPFGSPKSKKCGT